MKRRSKGFVVSCCEWMLGLLTVCKTGLLCRCGGGPATKSLMIVLLSIGFFFVNLSIIYYYVQNNLSKPIESSIIGNNKTPNVFQPLHMNSFNDDLGKCILNGNNKLGISALDRVKTKSCRLQIEDAVCRLQNGAFHDTMPLSGCHNYESKLGGLRIGCYLDKISDRQLEGHSYVFEEDNSREKCESHCYRAGYLYYGVEFGKECFCGDDFDAQFTIGDEKCSTYPCTGNSSQFCGGYGAIEIFRTGLIIKAAARVRKPAFVATTNYTADNGVQIMFLLQLNGRNIRQVRRLLKTIYSPRHLYYVHVDQRQEFMVNEMRLLSRQLSNLYVQPDGQSTIWGGASLLTMVEKAIERSMNIPEFSTWDYLVNLSESDFPVLTLTEMEAQLTANRGRSYLASHGYDTARFIQKQGFDFVFVECEERMWRIGKREEFPRGLRIDGGSDWIILHRDFARYSISDEELPVKLRKLFSSIILPVESFFHTLAANSIYCDHVIAGNLRLTNWNRKQGCRCATLKKVVDWCGCSPLVFNKETVEKFSLQRSHEKSFYFARKFESLIDVDAIGIAEKQAMRDRPHLLSTSSPSFNTSHLNFYSMEVDGYSKPLTLLASTLFNISTLSSSLQFGSLRSLHVYRENSEDQMRVVFTILPKFSSSPVELLVERIQSSQIFSPAVVDGYQLLNIQMGTLIDHKEEIFRGYSGYADHTSSPTIVLKWIRVPSIKTTVPSNKTSPSIKFLWKDQNGSLIATQLLKPYDSQYHSQFADLSLPSLKNLKPEQTGRWSVDVYSSDLLVGRVEFPIFSPQNEPQFIDLVSQFYNVKDVCSENCDQRLWSTVFPDPKADILFGYDPVKKFLV